VFDGVFRFLDITERNLVLRSLKWRWYSLTNAILKLLPFCALQSHCDLGFERERLVVLSWWWRWSWMDRNGFLGHLSHPRAFSDMLPVALGQLG
jgi:hypothetical protein